MTGECIVKRLQCAVAGLTALMAASAAEAAQPQACYLGPEYEVLALVDGRSPLIDDTGVHRFYPDRAMRRLVSGRVLMECLSTDGSVACTVVSETPQDDGFGAASLRLSKRFSLGAGLHEVLVIFTIGYGDWVETPCDDPQAGQPRPLAPRPAEG
jgi:hypothetical protein